jgi:hypothetical protein
VDANVRAIKIDCYKFPFTIHRETLMLWELTLEVFRVYALAARKQSCAEGIVSKE